VEVKRDILWRVYLCFLGIVALCAVVIGRTIYIQQFEGSYWKSKSDSLHTKIVNLEAERGTIYSEDGSMLSTSIPYFDIYIDFGAEGVRDKNGKRFKENVDSLSMALAGLFADRPAVEYKKILQQGYKNKDRYFLLHKNLSFDEYKKMRDFPLVRLGRNKSGFIADIKSKRLNPFGLLANRTIGLARDNAQNVGLERTYDTLLKGESGKRLVRFIAGGVAVPVEGYEVDAENGKDIITTLDVNIQDIAEQALLKMMVENECEHGTCMVMEVATGKIKAIANLGKTAEGNYWEDLNYGIRASEPGSTFKLMTMLAALEDKYITLNSRVDLEGGKWKVRTRTVYDSEEHGLGNVTVKEAFEHSSNVGMAKLALNYYSNNPAKFINHLKKLHLTQKSGVDLVGETNPIIKTPKSKTWSATTLPWMAFGYEVLVSPLQTLMVYNAVANNGKMMKPYLVSEVQQNGLSVQHTEPVVMEESICSNETLAQLKACLEGVMINGTGKTLQSPYYNIAAKTGTALVANGSRGYADHIYQSSFAGYFPANAPKYSCIVVIKNKPFAKKFYGAAVAGPVFKEIADKLFALNSNMPNLLAANIAKDSASYFYAGNTQNVKKIMGQLSIPFVDSAKTKYSSVYASNYKTVVNNKNITTNVMPNLQGLCLKDALYVLENMKAIVVSKGRGRVVKQSVEAGTAFNKKQLITIELN
jgi:cell division protein FtsI (penicillin-binding protein 3)